MNGVAKESREPLWFLVYIPHGEDVSKEQMDRRYEVLDHRGRPDGESIPCPMDTENEFEFWMPGREHLDESKEVKSYKKKIKGQWL